LREVGVVLVLVLVAAVVVVIMVATVIVIIIAIAIAIVGARRGHVTETGVPSSDVVDEVVEVTHDVIGAGVRNGGPARRPFPRLGAIPDGATHKVGGVAEVVLDILLVWIRVVVRVHRDVGSPTEHGSEVVIILGIPGVVLSRYNLGDFALARRTYQAVFVLVPLGGAGMAEDDFSTAGGVEKGVKELGFFLLLLLLLLLFFGVSRVVPSVVMGLHAGLLDALPRGEGSDDSGDEADGVDGARRRFG
jgi:hypothetical protein